MTSQLAGKSNPDEVSPTAAAVAATAQGEENLLQSINLDELNLGMTDAEFEAQLAAQRDRGPIDIPFWSAEDWYDLIPQCDRDREIDYLEVTEAASQFRPVTRRVQEAEEYTGDDCVKNYKRRRVSSQYRPNERYHAKVNETLACYKEDPYSPKFPEKIPCDTDNFPPGKINATPPVPYPDVRGYYPVANEALIVYQGELVRLDALLRGLLKVHENDTLVISALQARLDAQEAEIEAAKLRQNMPYTDTAQIKVMRAVSKNYCTREDLLAESFGIVTAMRRRDNSVRTLDLSMLSEQVSRPICPVTPEGAVQDEPVQVIHVTLPAVVTDVPPNVSAIEGDRSALQSGADSSRGDLTSTPVVSSS
jgi:hypothetical protein